MGAPEPRRAMLVGWRGGVGRAVLSLLAHHPRVQDHADRIAELHLIDAEDGPVPVLPAWMRPLPPKRLTSASDLARLLADVPAQTVVEVAHVGTLDCVTACAAHGADFLSTSLENWQARHLDRSAEDNRAVLAARKLVPPGRPLVNRGSHLVGSGMNPGIVNALVASALERFGKRVGAEPTAQGLDLYAILITEEDTTELTSGSAPAGTFAVTWSPEGCLDELFEPVAMYVDQGVPAEMDHPPFAAAYRVRCGDSLVDGMLVPHDEVVTLGWRHPEVEVAFVYRLPPPARAFLDALPPGDPSRFPVLRLYPPHVTEALVGRDRVGGFLCSRRHGELWLGFQTDAAQGNRWGTNATELQVAAGVLAGWRMLGRHRGIHVVEELDPTAYLAHVESILGPAHEFHDPDAPVLNLRARRV